LKKLVIKNMRTSDIIKLSTRMFKTNPSRTWLTILGMGVGTGAVVLMVGLGYGLQQIILEEIVFGESMLSIRVTTSGDGILKLDRKTVDDFLAMEQVLDVAPMASFPALITYGSFTGNIFLEGIGPNYLSYAGVRVPDGEEFSSDLLEEQRDKIIWSRSVLQLFGIENPEDALGEEASFRLTVPSKENPEETYEVKIDEIYTIMGVNDDEVSMSSIMLLSELERHVKVDNYERVQVRVINDEALEPVSNAIIEMGYDVYTLSETVEQARVIFQVVQIVLAAFGGVALTVSAIGMFNTMTVTLLERTSEIGIMRTIGASPSDIKVLFLSEAMVVGFLGGVSGIVMGVGIGFGLNTMLNFIASKFGGASASIFSFPLLFLLFIAIFSGVVGFLTGVFPARRASKLDPLEAIRD
jgi:putative ABC transport system permease protein